MMLQPSKTAVLLLLLLLSCLSSKTSASDFLQTNENERTENVVEISFSSSSHVERHQHRQLFGIWSLLFMFGPQCPPLGKAHADCVAFHSSGSGRSGGGGDSGGSAGSDPSDWDGSSDSSVTSNNNLNHENEWTTRRRFSSLMVMTAAVAAVVAIAGVIVGTRKRKKVTHPLAGSVGRRMWLFSNFADASLCGTARPDRVVEMTMSADDIHNPQYTEMV